MRNTWCMYYIDAHEYYKQLTMNLEQWLNNIFKSLDQNGFTIPTLIRSVLESSSSYHCDSLLFGEHSICSDLLAYNQTGAIFSWTFETVKASSVKNLLLLQIMTVAFTLMHQKHHRITLKDHLCKSQLRKLSTVLHSSGILCITFLMQIHHAGMLCYTTWMMPKS